MPTFWLVNLLFSLLVGIAYSNYVCQPNATYGYSMVHLHNLSNLQLVDTSCTQNGYFEISHPNRTIAHNFECTPINGSVKCSSNVTEINDFWRTVNIKDINFTCNQYHLGKGLIVTSKLDPSSYVQNNSCSLTYTIQYTYPILRNTIPVSILLLYVVIMKLIQK